MHPALRLRTALFCAGLLLSSSSAWCARDDERISSVESQIQAMDTVVQATKSPAEKTRLEGKLQRLRDELSILRERQALENRARALTDDRNSNPLESLREKLRLVDASEEEAKKRIQDLATKRRQAATDRDALAAQIEGLRDPDGSKKDAKAETSLAEMEERLYTRNEELRAYSLQREAAEVEVELAHEADRLREELRTLEVAPRPNLRLILDERENLAASVKRTLGIKTRAQDLTDGLKVAQDSLALAQQKLAKFDEELVLLEKQTGFFSSNARVEHLLTVQRGQKKAVQDRIPLLTAQVEALRKASQLLTLAGDLAAAEQALLSSRVDSIQASYLARLRWPAWGLAGVLTLYVIFAFGVLRVVCRRENRPIARRLARYAAVTAASGVIAGFLFDDLSMMAATMGVVSAALVISLQDAFASAFGWLVIMLAGKFRAGDRLEVDGVRGDVIDIDLLRTTLNEVHGWLGSDLPTGRVVVVPNNFIFRSKIINYSHEHPYIWGRIDLTLTFDTSVPRAAELFMKVLKQETQSIFDEARKESQHFRDRYGSDNAMYEPRIQTQIDANGVTLSLFFVAHFLHYSATRSRLHAALLDCLGEHQEVQLAFNTLQLLHANQSPAIPAPAKATATTTGTPTHPLDPIVIQAK